MIIGIGTDIVETARIAKMIEEHGDAFKSKIFTDAEREESETRKNIPQYFAGRWSAKEAMSKALGCGFGAKCSWQDIEIINNSAGKPEIRLSGTARITADDMGISGFHVSISHEKHYACSTVVVE
jgi:holo-[acyl-carrier protein] synthase